MKLLNVLKFGVGSVVCVSVLMACGDGKSANGFKSYKFSKTEMAENKAKQDAATAAGTPTKNASGNDDTTKTQGTTGAAGEDDGTVKPGTDQDDKTFSPIDDAAKSKMMTEGVKLSDEAGQQVAAAASNLSLKIDSELAKGDNEAAKGLVRGITVSPEGPDDARLLTLQAIVVIDGVDHVLDGSKLPVKFYKDGDQVPNLFVTLKKSCAPDDVAIGSKLYVAAKCVDEKCAKIDVILSFEATGGRASAVVVVENVNGQWAITGSNIGSPILFTEAQKLTPACEVPQAGQSQGAGGDLSSQLVSEEARKRLMAKSQSVATQPSTMTSEEARRRALAKQQTVSAPAAAAVVVSPTSEEARKRQMAKLQLNTQSVVASPAPAAAAAVVATPTTEEARKRAMAKQKLAAQSSSVTPASTTVAATSAATPTTEEARKRQMAKRSQVAQSTTKPTVEGARAQYLLKMKQQQEAAAAK